MKSIIVVTISFLFISIFLNLEPNESIQIKGEIIFDTKGLTKQDIIELEPFITDIKASIEEVISLKR